MGREQPSFCLPRLERLPTEYVTLLENPHQQFIHFLLREIGLMITEL